MTESFFKNDRPENEETKPIPELNVPNEEVESEETEFSARSQDILSDESRMASILSYIPILCFIPLLNMKENKEAQFHARQGVLLFLIELAALIFLIDTVSKFVFKAILIGAIALSVAGIYFALQGKPFKIPFIGDMADKTKL